MTLTSEYVGFANYRSTLVTMIEADQKKLNYIITTLINNALNHTRDNGAIMIQCRMVNNTKTLAHNGQLDEF